MINDEDKKMSLPILVKSHYNAEIVSRALLVSVCDPNYYARNEQIINKTIEEGLTTKQSDFARSNAVICSVYCQYRNNSLLYDTIDKQMESYFSFMKNKFNYNPVKEYGKYCASHDDDLTQYKNFKLLGQCEAVQEKRDEQAKSL